MRNLREVLKEAELGRVAIGHFNISDSTQFNAIVSAASAVMVPVIIGVSEGEESFIGMHNAVSLVKGARARGIEVYLNADHHHSVESCKAAIDAGFDAVIFDGVKLSAEENISKTREVVEYAREVEAQRQAQGDQDASILVEAELGYIGTSSKMLDEVPDGAGLEKTTPEQARDFVQATGVDLLAPSVGNLHGMLKSGNPKLDIERIASVREASGVPLVLHGGSGISDEDFSAGIAAGMVIVHINTEIRRAYREGIEQAFKDDREQIAPYKYMNKGYDALRDVVVKRLSLFNTAQN